MNLAVSVDPPTKHRFRPFFFALALIPVLLYILGDLSEDVWFRESFSWDAPLERFIHSFSRPWLDVMMRLITETGSTGAIVLTLCVAGWFVWKKQLNQAILLLISFGAAVSLNAMLKLVFARTRPDLFPPLMVETDFSFPSGHSVAATVLYGMLAVFLWRQRHHMWALIVAGWVLLVGVSRIYLGVHYPSDVVASIAVGTLWLFMVFAIFDWYEAKAPRPLQKHS